MRSAVVLVLVSLVLAGCSSGQPASSAATSSPSGTAGTSAPTPGAAEGQSPTGVPGLRAASPTAGPTPLAACPGPRSVSALPVLARPAVSPDDLLVLADGTLWVTDPVSGGIVHLDGAGRQLQRLDDPNAPEGMVALPDGRILLAEQRPNRLVALDPATGVRTTVATLPPRGTADGIDGLGFDAATSRVLIPDSPHGTLLAMPLGGGPLTPLATGLGRDVAAVAAPDGSVLVAVEGSRGLWRVPSGGGRAASLGDIGQLDDLVLHGRVLYATGLASGEVDAIDPATGEHRVLVTGIAAASAQGLDALPDGRLLVADSNRGVITVVAPCS